MANRKTFRPTPKPVRQHRFFSDQIKKKLIQDLDQGLVTIAEISKEYEVSRTAIYKWKAKFSRHYQRQTRIIIEPMSDTRKIQQLKEKIKQLEQALGQKQFMIDFYEKMIELAEEHYNIDIKKKILPDPPMVLGTQRNLEHIFK